MLLYNKRTNTYSIDYVGFSVPKRCSLIFTSFYQPESGKRPIITLDTPTAGTCVMMATSTSFGGEYLNPALNEVDSGVCTWCKGLEGRYAYTRGDTNRCAEMILSLPYTQDGQVRAHVHVKSDEYDPLKLLRKFHVFMVNPLDPLLDRIKRTKTEV